MNTFFVNLNTLPGNTFPILMLHLWERKSQLMLSSLKLPVSEPLTM